MNNKILIIILILLVFSAAIYSYMVAGYNQVSETPETKIIDQPEITPIVENIKAAKIYLMKIENDTPIIASYDVEISDNEEPIKQVMESLVDFNSTTELTNLIPIGSVLKRVDIEAEKAIIEFNNAFVDNFSGGSDEEGLLVRAIVKTVSQFKNIKQIELLADGYPVTTFGHIEIETPILTEKYD